MIENLEFAFEFGRGGAVIGSGSCVEDNQRKAVYNKANGQKLSAVNDCDCYESNKAEDAQQKSETVSYGIRKLFDGQMLKFGP